MEQYLIIGIVAFASSLLTFFSGFGLGTILTPAFVLFFPVEIAIAMTAVVHFLNNIFKFAIIGKHTEKRYLLIFGIPSVIGAYFGAQALLRLEKMQDIVLYLPGNIETDAIKLTIGILMFFFAIFELLPSLNSFRFSEKWLLPGGFVSGFFGGISGHQGALRAAFLVKTGLSSSAFVATGVAIALFVDLVRISVYFGNFKISALQEDWKLLLLGTIAAFAGALLGKRYLKKTKLPRIQLLVGLMMLFISLLLILNLI